MTERDGKDATPKRTNRLEKRVWILVDKGMKKRKEWILTKKISMVLGDPHKVFLRELIF
jgi:hypothetical protein